MMLCRYWFWKDIQIFYDTSDPYFLPWPVWSCIVYCRTTHQRDWCSEGTRRLNFRIGAAAVKGIHKMGSSGKHHRMAGSMVYYGQMAAELCL